MNSYKEWEFPKTPEGWREDITTPCLLTEVYKTQACWLSDSSSSQTWPPPWKYQFPFGLSENITSTLDAIVSVYLSKITRSVHNQCLNKNVNTDRKEQFIIWSFECATHIWIETFNADWLTHWSATHDLQRATAKFFKFSTLIGNFEKQNLNNYIRNNPGHASHGNQL